ncbi:response regulator [Brevibacillus borstelensis]|uniref:response regulator n=1 Tax=Brevibacillus borstelensis TaxID=45462 RepID=UPI00055FE32B|nr:response regulator [Brevibacillus borstelensis]
MKAILIDDEPMALHFLERQLSGMEDLQVVGKFRDPFMGKQAVETSDVDLVFLDIHIPECNGMELANQLLACKPGLHIVFVTAHDDYAIRAFEINALDYILKPVARERLRNTIQRIRSDREGPAKIDQQTDILKMSLFQQVAIADGEGKPLELRWRTAKGQQLFLYLVQHRGQIVPKTALVDLLWSDLDPDKALQQLYTAVYYIRKTLGPYEEHFTISSSSEGYLMKLEHVQLDVDQFDQFIQSEVAIREDTIQDYESALGLVKGDYLQEHDYVWAESERQRLQSYWVQLALQVVNWYYANHQMEKALVRCLDICHRFPLEEEANLLLMKIYAAQGKHVAVHQQYNRIKELLQAELQEQPSPFLAEWYEQWKEDNKE